MDSVLLSVEEEEQYEFTGGHFFKKLMGFKTSITNSNNLEATFVKLSEKKSLFYYRVYWSLETIRLELLFSHCDGQKIEEIVSLLMRYEN